MTLNRVDENMEKCITYLDKSVIVNESEDNIGDIECILSVLVRLLLL